MNPATSLYQPAPDDERIPAHKLPTVEAPGPTPSAEREARHRVAIRRMGACLFVVVDGIFFGSLFALYAILRASAPEIFAHGRYFLDAKTGAMENCILLASAMMAALAVRSARLGRSRNLVPFLVATLALAGLFLSVQVAEYAELSARGLLPGARFEPSESAWETPAFQREHPKAARYAAEFHPARADLGPRVLEISESAEPDLLSLREAGVIGSKAVYPDMPSEPRNAHLFFGVFFLITGVLGLHVIGGGMAFGWLLCRAKSRAVSTPLFGPLDSLTLYWNVVALLRVLLFPLLYLVH